MFRSHDGLIEPGRLTGFLWVAFRLIGEGPDSFACHVEKQFATRPTRVCPVIDIDVFLPVVLEKIDPRGDPGSLFDRVDRLDQPLGGLDLAIRDDDPLLVRQVVFDTTQVVVIVATSGEDDQGGDKQELNRSFHKVLCFIC